MNINVNLENVGIEEADIMEYQEKVSAIHTKLVENVDDESEFLGWMNLPSTYDKEEFEKIKTVAEKIRTNAEVFIVIGIGGSYLGAKAVIDSLTNSFYNLQSKENRKGPQIFFAGHNLSPNYHSELIDLISDKEVYINVISKSGTTTEPAIAFRFFKNLLEQKYGSKEAKNRIFVTTDKNKGALKTLADEMGYETFVIPDNIGGRYSVLTPVGLLPIAVAGIDIDALMEGAKYAEEKYSDVDVKYNSCYRYAIARNILYNEEKTIEILANYEPKLHSFVEWYKQLFGESEGKEQKGIFPVGMDFTTDLHSLGQYVQQGKRNLFETVLEIKENQRDLILKFEEENTDGLNYLAEKTVGYVNKQAMEGTIQAHVAGDVPNIKIILDKLDEVTIGHMIYFFEKACAVSANLLGVNPFNQPGVEEYKNNMFKLLEKPGY